MHVLAVAVGGMIGAVLRHIIGHGLEPLLRGMDWPLFLNGTLLVNLAGCLVLGALAAASERLGLPRPVHLGISVGLIGSFTTFSTFSVEALQLIELGSPASAAAYVLISALGGALLAGIGWIAAGRWTSGSTGRRTRGQIGSKEGQR